MKVTVTFEATSPRGSYEVTVTEVGTSANPAFVVAELSKALESATRRVTSSVAAEYGPQRDSA